MPPHSAVRGAASLVITTWVPKFRSDEEERTMPATPGSWVVTSTSKGE